MMRMKPDQWSDVIDTNLSGVFYATQVSCAAAIPVSSMLCHGCVLRALVTVGHCNLAGCDEGDDEEAYRPRDQHHLCRGLVRQCRPGTWHFVSVVHPDSCCRCFGVMQC